MQIIKTGTTNGKRNGSYLNAYVLIIDGKFSSFSLDYIDGISINNRNGDLQSFCRSIGREVEIYTPFAYGYISIKDHKEILITINELINRIKEMTAERKCKYF